MLYYETKERRNKIAGAVATLIYLLLLLGFMFLISFTFEVKEEGGGMLINFGDSETGSGLYDPVDSPISEQQQFFEPTNEPSDILTQDFEDAPNVQQPDRVRPTESQNVVVERPREVNPLAIYPGRTTGSTSTSEGTAATGTGNQGVLEGSPAGSHDGTGLGGDGMGFDLTGRSVMGELSRPVYGPNKSGRVVIQITVNPAGEVTNATYRAPGSTTTDRELVDAAQKAARRSKFSKIDGDGLQTGTITYNYELK